MNYLKAVFWDYPEFTDPDEIRRILLKDGNKRVQRWLLKQSSLRENDVDF